MLRINPHGEPDLCLRFLDIENQQAPHVQGGH